MHTQQAIPAPTLIEKVASKGDVCAQQELLQSQAVRMTAGRPMLQGLLCGVSTFDMGKALSGAWNRGNGLQGQGCTGAGCRL